MLTNLRIQNIVLIEKLDIAFHEGLCTLTGETGAGKSILLDSLGLAIGTRADSKLVRHGSDQAQVTAAFEINDQHPAYKALRESDIDVENGEAVILRRVLGADGRSKAFINDHPVSAGLLRQIGQSVLEIHGQFDTQGLMDAKTHLTLLDDYAGIQNAIEPHWNAWQDAQRKYQDLQILSKSSREQEDYLRQSLEDLDALEPQPGEEQTLAHLRDSLMNREAVLEGLNAAYHILNGDSDPVGQALGILSRISDKLGEQGAEAIAALDRGSAEIQEALNNIQAQSNTLEHSEHNLESIDDRLFNLRAQARKHSCEVDELAQKRDELAEQLKAIEHADEALEAAARAVDSEKKKYFEGAKKLSEQRHKAAQKLDQFISQELTPLKLERAIFKTQVTSFYDDDWEENAKKSGLDDLQFMISANGTGPLNPLNSAASGGELSRIMLALKVVMSETGSAGTLIFDEVDSGIGGSTADSVGERLARLSSDKQVLVVTHSPQVAARGAHHYIVQKQGDKTVTTSIEKLEDAQKRREEIARMLAGAEITDEAKAAADKLLETSKAA